MSSFSQSIIIPPMQYIHSSIIQSLYWLRNGCSTTRSLTPWGWGVEKKKQHVCMHKILPALHAGKNCNKMGSLHKNKWPLAQNPPSPPPTPWFWETYSSTKAENFATMSYGNGKLPCNNTLNPFCEILLKSTQIAGNEWSSVRIYCGNVTYN